MTYLDRLEKKIILERLVIGLEEPILIKGLGQIQAKIDSGNGGYNVIHGNGFFQQGDTLLFDTIDDNNNSKKISAKVIDEIEINMGGGNIEKRPVIELDVKFAGEEYKKIPFSVSDRSTNTHSILISKGFVENELQALIDVGAKNISNDGIDVLYGEGVGSTLSNITKKVGGSLLNTVKTAGDITHKVGGSLLNTAKTAGKYVISGKFVDDLEKFNNTMKGGDDVDPFVAITNGVKKLKHTAMIMGHPLFTGVKEGAIAVVKAWETIAGSREKSQLMAKCVSNANDITQKDKTNITNKITGIAGIKGMINDNTFDKDSTVIEAWNEDKLESSSFPINLVTSFVMNKGEIDGKKTKDLSGLEQKKKAWRELMDSQLEATEAIEKSNAIIKSLHQINSRDKATVSESKDVIIFKEAQLGLIEPKNPAERISTYTNPTSSNKSSQPPQNPPAEQQQQKADSPSESKIDEELKNIQEVTTDWEELCNFTLHFISLKKNPTRKGQLENAIEQLKNEIKELEDYISSEDKNSSLQSESHIHSLDMIDKMLLSEFMDPLEAHTLMHGTTGAQQSEASTQKDEDKTAKILAQTKETLKKTEEELKKTEEELKYLGFGKKSEEQKTIDKIIKGLSIDKTLGKLFSLGIINPQKVAPVIKILAKQFSDSDLYGFFCLSYTKLSETELKKEYLDLKRIYHFFEDSNCIAYKKVDPKTTDKETEETTDKETETSKTSETADEEAHESDEEELWIKNKIKYLKDKSLL